MVVDIFSTDKKYDIIYADPAWQYDDKLQSNKMHGRCPYPCMSIKEICELPVKNISSKDSILFLWVTMPFLQEGLDVIKAWGFTYKTCGFCWHKLNPKSLTSFSGLGRWTMGNEELCLLATKGHPKRVSKDIKQSVLEPREEHSKKPNEVRLRIKRLMGDDKTAIELFARQNVDGWDCWGNEV